MTLDYEGKSSFAGVKFGIIQDGGAKKRRVDYEADYAAAQVGGGDTTYVQLGGRKSGEVRYTIVIKDTDADTLEGKKRQTGILSIDGRTMTAIMIGYSGWGEDERVGYVQAEVRWFV